MELKMNALIALSTLLDVLWFGTGILWDADYVRKQK